MTRSHLLQEAAKLMKVAANPLEQTLNPATKRIFRELTAPTSSKLTPRPAQGLFGPTDQTIHPPNPTVPAREQAAAVTNTPKYTLHNNLAFAAARALPESYSVMPGNTVGKMQEVPGKHYPPSTISTGPRGKLQHDWEVTPWQFSSPLGAVAPSPGRTPEIRPWDMHPVNPNGATIRSSAQ